jgi:hypothetical protein
MPLRRFGTAVIIQEEGVFQVEDASAGAMIDERS